jgi:ribulose-5-phosphate 4-epimerase/fuculose-1-phosphate aldolase
MTNGGLAAWAPAIVPPIGVDLDIRQELACAFRILARGGFGENIAGHITVVADDGDSLWINPWGLWWEEVSASDVCRVSMFGDVVEGRWDVTPAAPIHTELHRARADARVVIHNHPYHATVLAAVGLLPEVVHQTATMFDGQMALVEEYTGEIDTPDLGSALAAQIGDATVAVLANHGVVVTGETIPEATYRAATIDRTCRLTVDVLLLAQATGRPIQPIAGHLRPAMQRSLIERGPAVFWAGAVRRLLRDEPDVLE